jgi:hypothetical protein
MSEVSKADRVIAPEKPTSLSGYASSKLNDLDVTATFYDQLLVGFGVGRLVAQAYKAAYHRIRKVHFDVIVPFTGMLATVGAGGMRLLEALSRAQVREVHATALQLTGAGKETPELRAHNVEISYNLHSRHPNANKPLVFRFGPDEV